MSLPTPPPLPGAVPKPTAGVIGIDLGTSNSVLAYAADGAALTVLPVPQVVAAGTVESRSQLPSFIYLPGAGELPDGALGLPWNGAPRFCVGAFARSHGPKVPHRLVRSAKSWLCNEAVDRRAAILPWGPSDPAIDKVSPLLASAHVLSHLRSAWIQAAEGGAGRGRMSDYEVVITVPASFDPAARDLTVEAARAAGIANPILLEEPTAALYAWLHGQGDAWREQLSVGDVVLVVDVGGGTTDFSLIRVTEEGGSLGLERVAVGDHILLGGDNMDFALAFAIRKVLEKAGKTLDQWQLQSLVQSARAAKEALLGDRGVERFPVVIPGRGSKLMGKNIKGELTRAQVMRIVGEGFFPDVPVSAMPQERTRAGLSQLGLPYAQDAAITRHLAAFLSRHAHQLDGQHTFVRPNAVLFCGGVFKSELVQGRLVSALNDWLETDGADPVTVLSGADLDLSVARGAVYYGQARNGAGVRIRGGTAHAYYVGVEEPMPAVPGFDPPIHAVCVAPFGMEEGTSATLERERFGLVTGELARFRFFASATRRDDTVGAILSDWNDRDLRELEPIETVFEDADAARGRLVEVRLQSSVTPTGTLLVEALADDDRRWKLEFRVRGESA